MLTTVEGVFREGRIELREVPPDVEGARVIVTFLPESPESGADLSRSASEANRRMLQEEPWLLIDTNIITHFLRERDPVLSRFAEALDTDNVFVSSDVVVEEARGVAPQDGGAASEMKLAIRRPAASLRHLRYDAARWGRSSAGSEIPPQARGVTPSSEIASPQDGGAVSEMKSALRKPAASLRHLRCGAAGWGRDSAGWEIAPQARGAAPSSQKSRRRLAG